MISLRVICRTLLGLWFVLILGMSVVVAHTTRTEVSGNLLAFLLTSSAPSRPIFRVSPAPPVPAAPEEPAVPAAPPASEPPAPAWQPMARGTGQGSGTLTGPEVIVLPDGGVQVLFNYEGTPGQATAFKANRHATSVDLHGPWRRVAFINRQMDKGTLLSRLQVAEHKGYIRVSATAHGETPPEETTEFSPTQIRVTFSAPVQRN